MWRSCAGLFLVTGLRCLGSGLGLDATALVQSTKPVREKRPLSSGEKDRDAGVEDFDSGITAEDITSDIGKEDPIVKARPIQLEDDPDADKFLVDNSELQHRGPGVLYRKSMNEDDTAGKDKFASWGTVVSGVEMGGGWVKVGQLYLPTEVRGSTVLVRQGSDKAKVHVYTVYAPTKMRAPGDTWIDINITGAGQQPSTYNAVVLSRSLGPYTIEDVPEVHIQKISRTRRFVPLKQTADGYVEVEAEAWTEEDDSVRVRVEDFVGNGMQFKLKKNSPIKELMAMACQKVSLTLTDCLNKVDFILKGRRLDPDSKYSDVGLTNGDSIFMLKMPR